MKNGKRPTANQRKLIQKWGLNSENWLVVKDTATEMVIIHRHSDTTRTIHKNATKKAAILIGLALAAVISLDLILTNTIKTQASVIEPTETACQTHTATTSPEIITPEETPVPTQKPATEPIIALYNVPLDEGLQLHIIEQAEAHGIDPAIIFAMAWRESTYNTSAIGDNGRSYGLLQVQKRWHIERMERLGCTDLLDPFQNVTVGMDYLAELLADYDRNIGKALTAYNRGEYSGTVTGYARTIMAKADELRKGLN